MKAIMLIVSGLLICNMATATSYFRVRHVTFDGVTHLLFNDKAATREQCRELIQKIAQMDKDQTILVMTDEATPAAAFIATINDLQQAGLHSLVLMSPALEKNERGHYVILVDCLADDEATPFFGKSGFYKDLTPTEDATFKEALDGLDVVPPPTMPAPAP